MTGTHVVTRVANLLESVFVDCWQEVDSYDLAFDGKELSLYTAYCCHVLDVTFNCSLSQARLFHDAFIHF